MKSFNETNHRNPSKYDAEERGKYCNWFGHKKKLLNAGEMKEDRVALFEKLLEMGEKIRRVNPWGLFSKKKDMDEIISG